MTVYMKAIGQNCHIGFRRLVEVMHIIDATERLTTCEFLEERYYQTSPIASYLCAHCGEEVIFCTRDFRRHHFLPSTNLSVADATAIDKLVHMTQNRYCCDFLDFYCLGCDIGVRIYYEVDEYIGVNW